MTHANRPGRVALVAALAIALAPWPGAAATPAAKGQGQAQGKAKAKAKPPVRLPPAPPPGDPLEMLWGHRIEISHGAPQVTIRLAEGLDEALVVPRGAARLEPRGAPASAVPAWRRLRVRAKGTQPAVLAWAPVLAHVDLQDAAGLERARATWTARGVATRTRVAGATYGIAGRVVDSRRTLLVADGAFTEASAADFAAAASARWGERVEVEARVVTRPRGTVEVTGPGGTLVARGDGVVVLDVPGGAGFTVGDKPYRGRLLLAVDAHGRLAAVAALPVEELLRGIVPSEMPSRSPAEALKSQAVTARSNVLAQIGTRHLSDPWALCNEVHCQAYHGESSYTPATDAAVRDTAGQVLLRPGSGRIVDGVYSAMCGGHGEDADAVWGGPPDPSLRGLPDVPAGAWDARAGSLADESRLAAFLAAPPAAYCGRAPGARPDRFRWERRFSKDELDALVASLGTGHVTGLEVASRGVSGRALELRIHGERGDASVRGELRIRRLLGNLSSAMFLVARDGEGWLLRGGGWGHGAGMCQWGAIGRATAGQDHRTILGAYFSGAEVARIY